MNMRATFPAVAFACAVTLLMGCSERNVGASAGSEQTQSTAQLLAKRSSAASANATEKASTESIPAAKAIFDALRAPPGASADPLSPQELQWRSLLAGKAREGTLSEDERALWDGLATHNRMRVRALITAAIAPLPAWPMASVVDASHGPDNARFTREAQAWAAERYAGVELANAVATHIAGRIAKFPARDADDAERRILDAYDTLDYDALLARYDVTRRSTFIQTGESQHVHFVLANGDDVRIDATGPLVVRAHAPWFGNGNLSGNAYQLSFAANASDTHSTSTERGIDTSSSATQHVDANAAAK